MGTAEDSLIFYDISRFLPESQFAWMEHPGLGRVTINLAAARPTYEILTFLQGLGLPNFALQALMFWIILAGSGLGVYLLVKEFFPSLAGRFIFLSVIFYWFNPLTLVSVWNRFLSNYIFSFGLLPVAAFLFVRGLRTKNFLWSFLLILILPLYSFAFSYVAFDVLLWIFFFLVTLLFWLTHKEQKVNFYVKYFFMTVILFFLTNFWWIGQLTSLKLYQNIASSVINYEVSTNLGTLDALSKKMGNLTDIFGLVNASFINENSLAWVKTFFSPPLMLASYLIVLIILYAIASNIRNRSVVILAGLLFTGIYLAKGTNPPFGEIYKLIFTNMPFLQVFRNPFEKGSFILSLSTSLLVGFSVFNLIHELPKKFGNLVHIGILGFILLVWGFPFYTRLVFTSPEPPANDPQIGYQVKVPAYYQQADQWLERQRNNFRFIGFPLGDEGITYNWEKGYSGVELSSALFSTPGILHNTAVPYYNELVPQIQKTLLSQDDFIKLANVLNARFFFVRHDINFEYRKMENPVVFDSIFAQKEESGEVKKVAIFGHLTFWENLKWQDRTFYPAKKIVKSSTKQEVSELPSIDVNQGEVLVDVENLPPLESDSVISISYKRINPARYIVHIKNQSPFILVFSELFNDAWQASYQNKNFPHFRSNFYANGWLIDKTGEFDITLEYLPQRLLEAGEKVSLISYSLVVLISILLVSRTVKMKGK